VPSVSCGPWRRAVLRIDAAGRHRHEEDAAPVAVPQDQAEPRGGCRIRVYAIRLSLAAAIRALSGTRRVCRRPSRRQVDFDRTMRIARDTPRNPVRLSSVAASQFLFGFRITFRHTVSRKNSSLLTTCLTWRNAKYVESSKNKRPVPHHREDSMGRARRLSHGPTNSRET
jgi:hypothetical protein